MGLRDRLGRLKNSRAVGGISKIIEWANLNKATAAFLLIIFIAVGSVAGYKTTRWLETPQFCSISVCHTSMYPYAEYFIQSAHGQAQTNYKCMDCHGETRIGPIENKYLGVMLSHALDSPPVLIGLVEGKIPDPQFDPLYPTVPSERCLRCHAPDADIEDAYPVTAKDHSSPIDVSKEFEWVLENPRGNKYVCKNCHAFVVHPSDTELLPTERGKKYDYAHPGFPKINFGPWQQAHWHLLRDGGKGGLEFDYTGNAQSGTYTITSSGLEVNGIERTVDKDMCKICHKLPRLRPENMDGKCQGCHNHGLITLFEHEPHLHLPNPNDYLGVKGVVGGAIAGGGDAGGH